MIGSNFNIATNDLIVVTGAAGFIGSRVVAALLHHGFHNIRCLVRPSSNLARLESLLMDLPEGVRVEIRKGNLLSMEDCLTVAGDAALIYHLAAGRGEKSFPDAFLNSVVSTRNLLEICRKSPCLKRFVNVSSFSVYSNRDKPRGRYLDESCPIEKQPELRGDAYTFAKVKQDELVAHYGKQFGIPYVMVRPGVVYGAGNTGIHGRVGLGTFGIFLHFGGSNLVPFTCVENCADAVVLAGLKPGVEGEVFNVVDDDLPSSRKFLRLYKKHVKPFKSVFVPHWFSYLLCCLWENYSAWSEGQLPPVYNRRTWHAYWKKTRYSNSKLKQRLGWTPNIPTAQAMHSFFQSCREGRRHA